MADHRRELSNIHNLIDSDKPLNNEGKIIALTFLNLIDLLSHKSYYKDLKSLKHEMTNNIGMHLNYNC